MERYESFNTLNMADASKEFGKLIKSYRLDNKLTQVDLAKILNVAHSTVVSWEKGRALPNGTNLHALAKCFNVKELTDKLQEITERGDTNEQKQHTRLF